MTKEQHIAKAKEYTAIVDDAYTVGSGYLSVKEREAYAIMAINHRLAAQFEQE